MKKITICIVLCFCVLLTACSKKPAETTPTTEEVITLPTAAGPLELSQVKMSANLWSSPNGATVNIEATPSSHADSDTADFVVRLEGEDVITVPCQWSGSAYTASADLNAEDGYCYYILLNGTEFAVNTPTQILDETLVNMATSLESYCSITVNSSDFSDHWLSINSGSIAIQPPMLADGDQHVTCLRASLVLIQEAVAVAQVELNLPEQQDNGLYQWELNGTSFKVDKDLEDDSQLTLLLDVELSNRQTMLVEGGAWFYNDGQLLLSVG